MCFVLCSHLRVGLQSLYLCIDMHTYINTYTHTHFYHIGIFKDFIVLFIFRETGREGEREEEKHQCVVTYCAPLNGDLACNPGMCPAWESNQ